MAGKLTFKLNIAPDIVELDWSHSSLSAVPESIFTYERTLEKLDISCNQICDLPPSLFHCHELKELDLCDNDITTIPPAIAKFLKLVKLDLSRNAITDVADAVKSCKNLVYLDLSLNQLQKLPEGISQLVNLEELFLNDTYLEFLHANFGRLTKLKVLELRENSLQTLPKSMTRLNHLQRIDIGQNDIFELPEVIGTMTSLTELWCDNNNIRSIPKFIGNLTKLTCLDASQNDIADISDEIGKCVHLSDLTLASNSLESLPDSFPKLESLTVLRLDSNSIQYLPEDLGNLKNLQELTLIRNLLKTLPSSIGLMRKLHTLYLDDNLLTALPKEIGSCSALSVLSVAKNRLVALPSEVGHLSNLKVLTLSGNLLPNLPVSLLNIAMLGALWLSESQSKPLLPLNKEIEPNGQHVLTCYLLPQLPSTNLAEVAEETNDNDENLPRRSRPSIKFVTDLEPQPTESNLSKRLLRAPTPYPKELRALAKHASHLRNSKDQNGDLIINDEPEYEGDYACGDEDTGKDNENLRRKNETNGGHFYGSNSQQPALPVKDYAEDIVVVPPYRSAISGTSNSIEENNFQHFPAISLIDPRPSLVSSTHEDSKFPSKQAAVGNNTDRDTFGPPPYHVAARRAAFFRISSSPGPQSPIQLNLDATRTTPTTIFPAPRLSSTSSTIDGTKGHISPITSTEPSVNIPGVICNSNTSSGENQHSNLMTGNISSNEQKLLYMSKGSENPEHTVINPLVGINTTNKIQNDVNHLVNKQSVSSTLSTVTTMSEIATITAPSIVQPKTEPTTTTARKVNEIIETTSSVTEQHNHFSGISVMDSQQFEKLNDTDQRKSKMKKIITNTVEDFKQSTNTSTVANTNTSLNSEQVPKPATNVAVDNVRQDWSSSFKESSAVSSVSESETQFQSGSDVGSNTNQYMSNSTGLSSTESFSRIPVFSSSSSRIPSAVLPTPAEVQVPLTTYQTSTNTSSKITQPSINAERSSNNITASSSWSRIPKLPIVANTSTEANMNANLIKKPEIIGPKPSLVRTASDRSRIPNKSSNIVAPPTVPPPPIAKKPLSTSTSAVPTTSNSNTTSSSFSKIPRFGEQQQQPHLEPSKLERTLSGTRIPKYNEVQNSVRSSSQSNSQVVQDQSIVRAEAITETSASPTGGGSKIPTIYDRSKASAGRKPWIFGTHRNIVVVPVEYIKTGNFVTANSSTNNHLGFTVTDVPLDGNGNGGVYVDSKNNSDDTVKIGDKILQVDGIDVANMSVDIVRKILSNCQENIHLLVSRHK